MGQLSGKYKYLFFDADDTLWENEYVFREAEARFEELLSAYTSGKAVQKMLWERQEALIPYFGYGAKTYSLGMTETAIELCGGMLPGDVYYGIRQIIQQLIYHEFELIEGVEETLKELSGKYILVCATKGDLVEQKFKFRKSGLGKYFHHVVVMENKSEKDYLELCAMHDIVPEEMLMIGNSVKSDIAPVVNIGGTAIHVPHELVWVHEMMDMPQSDRIFEINGIEELKNLL